MRVTNCTNLSISVSDPLLMYVRVLNYRNRLRDVFDNLFIGVSGCQSNRDIKEIEILMDFFNHLSITTNNLKIDFFPNDQGDHGKNIKTLIKTNWGEIRDTILLMEDDDFIINDNELVKYLLKIQSGEIDFFGRTRGSCNNPDYMEFIKQIIIEDNLVENYQDGFHPHFWPTHFMIAKRLIHEDDTFDTFHCKAGTEINIRGRNYKFNHHTVGDTFVTFSLKLWNRIKKCYVHNVYKMGTPEYVDKFNYCFNHGFLYDWLPVNESIEKIALNNLQYHIGSASCLNRFWVRNIDITSEPMFKEVENNLNRNHIDGVLEVYRRYHIYKIVFNAVKDYNEFSYFKDGYEYNFSVADEYFKKIRIEDLIATKDYKMMPESIYGPVFRYIVGK